MPLRSTRKRFSPQGCGFFIVSVSPARTSMVFHPPLALVYHSFGKMYTARRI